MPGHPGCGSGKRWGSTIPRPIAREGVRDRPEKEYFSINQPKRRSSQSGPPGALARLLDVGFELRHRVRGLLSASDTPP